MGEATGEADAMNLLARSGLAGGALVLLAALLYVLRDFLNPIVLGIAAAILLWPYRRNQAARGVLLVTGFLLLLWLLVRLAGVLVPFVLAYLLAYLLNPVVETLEQRWRIPRWGGALALTLTATGVVVLLFILVIPAVVGELEQLATNVFHAMAGFGAFLRDSAILERLENAGVVDRAVLIENLTGLVQEQATALANSIPAGFQGVIRSISSLIQFVTISAITPVLFYYTIKDFDPISKRMTGVFPLVRGSREYLDVAGNVIGNYLRGQLTICAIAAAIISIALMIFDVPFALLIGLFAGVMNLIPNIGIVITQVVGISLALIFGDPGIVKALIVMIVLLAESFLEQAVLTPKIQTKQVGLHPVLIMLSLFVFGSLMGLIGLLIAVPATALLVTAYSAYRHELTLDLGPPKGSRAFERLLKWRRRQAVGVAGSSGDPTASTSSGDPTASTSSGDPNDSASSADPTVAASSADPDVAGEPAGSGSTSDG